MKSQTAREARVVKAALDVLSEVSAERLSAEESAETDQEARASTREESVGVGPSAASAVRDRRGEEQVPEDSDRGNGHSTSLLELRDRLVELAPELGPLRELVLARRLVQLELRAEDVALELTLTLEALRRREGLIDGIGLWMMRRE